MNALNYLSGFPRWPGFPDSASLIFQKMPTAERETLDSPTTDAKDWGAARFLTRELERTERLAASIAQWDLTVRLFRAVERQQFFEKESTELDRANHQALLHVLIGLGQQLALRIEGFSDQELASFGITRPDLLAYIGDLEDSFFLWHVPDFEPGKTAKLEQRSSVPVHRITKELFGTPGTIGKWRHLMRRPKWRAGLKRCEAKPLKNTNAAKWQFGLPLANISAVG